MKSSTLKFAVLFILLTVLFTPSCLEDLVIDDVDCGCQNGGYCIDNTCECPPGYTGIYCETYVGTPAPVGCPFEQQTLSENQIRAALQSFSYDGTANSTITEAREMLKHICSSVNQHAGDGGYVCGRMSNGKHITIWINTYNKPGTYGIRYNSVDNHSHFSSNNSYFEIAKGSGPIDPGPIDPPETNKMVVAIANERKDCDAYYYYNNPVYAYYHGAATNSALAESARNWINQHYSGHESITTHYSEGKGNYVMLISTNKSMSPNCPRQTFGIGFGHDRNEALKNAKDFLYGANWYWNYSDPFTTVLDKTF